MVVIWPVPVVVWLRTKNARVHKCPRDGLPLTLQDNYQLALKIFTLEMLGFSTYCWLWLIFEVYFETEWRGYTSCNKNLFSHLLAKFQYAGIDRAMRHVGRDGTVADPESHVLRGISFL